MYYHWSPRDRRESIQLKGLLSRQYPSCTRHPHDGFRQAKVCVSADIETAWEMSAGCFGSPGQKWDLWFLLPDKEVLEHYCTPEGDVLEYRTESVPPNRVWRIIERIS
jgi:hypothetical protein